MAGSPPNFVCQYRVAQDEDGVGAAAVVGRAERASEDRRDAEDAEEVVRHDTDVDAVGFAALQEVEVHLVVFDQCVEGARLLAIVVQLLDRHVDVRASGERRRLLDEHQPVGFGVGQGLQQNAVDHAEDGGVGPDPQTERQHGGQRVAAVPEQRAGGEPKVAGQVVHPVLPFLSTGYKRSCVNRRTWAGGGSAAPMPAEWPDPAAVRLRADRRERRQMAAKARKAQPTRKATPPRGVMAPSTRTPVKARR